MMIRINNKVASIQGMKNKKLINYSVFMVLLNTVSTTRRTMSFCAENEKPIFQHQKL